MQSSARFISLLAVVIVFVLYVLTSYQNIPNMAWLGHRHLSGFQVPDHFLVLCGILIQLTGYTLGTMASNARLFRQEYILQVLGSEDAS